MADTTRPELLRGIQRALSVGVRPFDRRMSESWEEFFAVYNVLLHKFAVRLRCPGDIVEDVVATVWMDVLRCLPKFEYDRSRGGFRRWLYTLVQRRMIDEVRQRHRRAVVLRDGLNTDFWLNCLDRGSTTPVDEFERAFEEEVAQTVLARYLERAPDKEREIVQLCFVEGQTPTQAAQRLGASGASVRQALRRGRLRLRMIASELFGAAGGSAAGADHGREVLEEK